MPTTSLTVDNELLSATSIEAAREARDLRHVVTPFLAEHARVHGQEPRVQTAYEERGGRSPGCYVRPETPLHVGVPGPHQGCPFSA